MGVRPPEVEDFQEEPKTPPGIGTEDDLFSDTETKKTTTTPVFNFQSIIPVLPAKGVYEDYLIVDHWDAPNEKKYCGKCFEDVKRDLKKLAEAVDSVRNERDTARKESEVLKKKVEELTDLLKKKEDMKKGDVVVNIKNGNENFDVIVRNNGTENETGNLYSGTKYNKGNKFGVVTFSINLPRDKPPNKSPFSISTPELKTKRSVADLRREFFAKELESEQKPFTARSFLEIIPEKRKEMFRSKLNIRVKPKKDISGIISKLSSRMSAPILIPDPTPIAMFQRFEKTKTVWLNEFQEHPFS